MDLRFTEPLFLSIEEGDEDEALLRSEQKPEMCDATKDDKNYKCRAPKTNKSPPAKLLIRKLYRPAFQFLKTGDCREKSVFETLFLRSSDNNFRNKRNPL